MSDIKQELDRIRDRISDPSFLANKGLSNEVGIHVFCYGNGDNNSGSIRDDYDNPEDLWEDNPDWYEDEDEAWDEWENG